MIIINLINLELIYFIKISTYFFIFTKMSFVAGIGSMCGIGGNWGRRKGSPRAPLLQETPLY